MGLGRAAADPLYRDAIDSPSSTSNIVWFRRDLRLTDNPAWVRAVLAARPICALFVLDPVLVATAGELRRRLLLAHLSELDTTLAELGGRLRGESGDPASIVPRLALELGAEHVFLNADTTPYARRRDAAVARKIPGRVEATWGTLVQPPGAVLTRAGAVSHVFTPFWKTWEQVAWEPWPSLRSEDDGAVTVLDEPGAGLPAPRGDPPEAPGERGALERLAIFDAHADDYLDERDIPSVAGTSSLSADLRFGTISPRHIATRIGTSTRGRAGFVRQLAWRDWYAHLIDELPHLRTRAMRPDTAAIEWIDDDEQFEAWSHGLTGYPIIDAGMRELIATGRMHNRVRMLCASFLVKDLLIDWRRGERWFRTMLIDADVSQNVGNWQWVAGAGPDAAPFFRVFNPTMQSRKFDADGAYIRRWVPELRGLDASQIHDPSTVGTLELAGAGVMIGTDYPPPIVDHDRARHRALAVYGAARDRSREQVTPPEPR